MSSIEFTWTLPAYIQPLNLQKITLNHFKGKKPTKMSCLTTHGVVLQLHVPVMVMVWFVKFPSQPIENVTSTKTEKDIPALMQVI